MVAPGVWAAGTIQCADNADGITFRIYDVRGEEKKNLQDSYLLQRCEQVSDGEFANDRMLLS